MCHYYLLETKLKITKTVLHLVTQILIIENVFLISAFAGTCLGTWLWKPKEDGENNTYKYRHLYKEQKKD
jgi:hypothetical protein